MNAPEETILTWYLVSSTGQKYDSLSFLNELTNDWIIIKKEDWSDWITIKISTIYGILPCLLKIKILELSDEGTAINIQTSAIYNTKGWTKPD